MKTATKTITVDDLRAAAGACWGAYATFRAAAWSVFLRSWDDSTKTVVTPRAEVLGTFDEALSTAEDAVEAATPILAQYRGALHEGSTGDVELYGVVKPSAIEAVVSVAHGVAKLEWSSDVCKPPSEELRDWMHRLQKLKPKEVQTVESQLDRETASLKALLRSRGPDASMLNDWERAVIEALKAEGPMQGDQLARRANREPGGGWRTDISRMVRYGLIAHCPQRGYHWPWN